MQDFIIVFEESINEIEDSVRYYVENFHDTFKNAKFTFVRITKEMCDHSGEILLYISPLLKV